MNILVLTTRGITIRSFLMPILSEIEKSELFKSMYIASSCNGDEAVISRKHEKFVFRCLPVYSLGSKILFPFNIVADIFVMVKLLRELDIDLVFTHTPLISHLVRIASFFRPTSILYYVHGFRFTNNCRTFKASFFRLVEKVLSVQTSGYILINEEDCIFARRHLKKKSYFVDGVGVSDKFYSYQCVPSGRRCVDLRILVVAAYKDEKGYSDVLFLADWLSRNHSNIYIDCYGYGSFVKYQKLADLMGVKNIFFNEYVENLLPVFEKADLFLSASRREGLPVSIMEAMCTCKIVVASNVRGNRDLINNRKNGFLYDLDKPDSLTAIIDDIAKVLFHENHNDIAYLSRIKKSANNTCTKRFSRENLAKLTVQILKDFL